MAGSYSIGLTASDADLEGIRQLQQANLKDRVSLEEAQREGFTTAVYSLDFLKEMHTQHPSIVAWAGGEVVGYALVALPAVRHGHPLLEDLFAKMDLISFRGRLLHEAGYVVVGQLCVDKRFRGLGLVPAMYGRFRDCLSDRFEFCAADVDRENTRSLRAHIKAGFEIVDSLTYGGAQWDMLVWDWRRL